VYRIKPRLWCRRAEPRTRVRDYTPGRFAAAAAAAAPTAARASRVELLQTDILDVPLSTYAAHVVALYLLPTGHATLEPYLAKHLPPGCGARVVAHGWPVPGWQPVTSQVRSPGETAVAPSLDAKGKAPFSFRTSVKCAVSGDCTAWRRSLTCVLGLVLPGR
jgi:hypothetical protein